MSQIKQRITNCLWFDFQSEEAANFYTSIFPNSKIGSISRYGKEGYEYHGKQEGTVMAISFELDGQEFSALNGGPQFSFNESISLVINCANQQEIDHYWAHLTKDGSEGVCGWLKDKYGVSWQVVPVALFEMLADPDIEKIGRVTNAFLQMKKFDLAKLLEAYHGN